MKYATRQDAQGKGDAISGGSSAMVYIFSQYVKREYQKVRI